jgi:hypothetical protein
MASRGWEISSTWEVDGGAGAALSDHVTVRDVHSSDGSGVPENACIRLVPGPEKQSCEVTGGHRLGFLFSEMGSFAMSSDLLGLWVAVSSARFRRWGCVRLCENPD